MPGPVGGVCASQATQMAEGWQGPVAPTGEWVPHDLLLHGRGWRTYSEHTINKDLPIGTFTQRN